MNGLIQNEVNMDIDQEMFKIQFNERRIADYESNEPSENSPSSIRKNYPGV